MNTGMKMMVLSKRRGYAMDEGAVESRRKRDSRGRFRSEVDDMDGSETRMNGHEYDGKEKMGGYKTRPFPVYEGGGYMNQIGFMADQKEMHHNYKTSAEYFPKSEYEYKTDKEFMGKGKAYEPVPMSKEMAEEWTMGMKNEDGTMGPHWNIDQVKQLMAQKGIRYDPWEFYAVLNMIYSDFCAVLKKHNVNNVDVYSDLASAWLNDKDAVKNKASAYYESVVKW